MTPEELCGNRPIRTVPAHSDAEVLFQQDGQPALLRCRNERNTFEVLVSVEKQAAAMPALCGPAPVSLTGYWRRRSGYRDDGSRHFVWCLVLLQVETTEEAAPLAA